jgi:hypothetical protein
MSGVLFPMINLPIEQAEEVAESIQWIATDNNFDDVELEMHKDIIAAYHNIIEQLKVIKPDSYLLTKS